MHCEYCGRNLETIVILNIPSKKYIGSYNTFACIDCSKNNDAYCLRHEIPHLGFIDGTTACRLCIEEKVECLGEKVANNYFCELLKYLPNNQLKELHERFEPVSKSLNESIEKSIFRSIITYAMRFKKSHEEVMENMIEHWELAILS